jgi:DNA-binding beta-propeller fold protein YncE
MRALRSLLILAPLLAGCSERARLNPFDPRNPVTSGRPQDFAAYARRGYVTLTWRPGDSPELVGYKLMRRGPGDTDFVDLFGTLGARTDSAVDLGVQNRSTYSYRLLYVFTQGVGTRPAEDVATPGPQQPWVLDAGAGSLLRLTADGRRTLGAAGGLFSPTRLALDTVNGRIWVAQTFDGRVSLYEPDGTLVRTLTDFGFPGAMAVDVRDRSLWVCDELRNQVRHVDENGSPVGMIPVLVNISQPTGVAVDPRDRTVWVCERGAGRVRKFNSDGAQLFSTPVATPARVAVDSLTGEGWVSDFDGGRVLKLSETGVVLQTRTGLFGPLGLAVDHRRGLVWVALGREDAVVALYRDQSTAARLDGVPVPSHLALELYSGEAWVVAGGAGELWRVASDGSVALRRGGFNAPADVAVDPDR